MRPKLVWDNGSFWWQYGDDATLREKTDEHTAKAIRSEVSEAFKAYERHISDIEN